MVQRKKIESASQLAEQVRQAKAMVFTDYRGMTVKEATELRVSCRQVNVRFQVVKNRLALRALKEEFPEDLRGFFQGPTAIAYTLQDPIKLARIIKDFSSKHKALKVKGGLLEGQFFPGERFAEISSLQSKKDLLAKMGYLMAHPLIKLARTWQAPLNSIGRLLSQSKPKK